MLNNQIKSIVKYLSKNQYGYRKPELFINLTYKCPLRCKYCYVDYNKAEDFTYEDIEYLFTELILKNNHIKLVTFFGGEPALKIDIIEKILDTYMDKLLEKGIHIAIITSFSVNRERLLLLKKKYKYFEIVISFDEYSNDRIYQNNKPFKVLSYVNLNQLSEYSDNICFHTVLDNSDSFKNLKLLQDIYKTHHIYYSWCWNKTPTYRFTDDDIKKYKNIIQRIIDEKSYYPRQFTQEIRNYLCKDNIGCGLGSELFLSANGSISPCSISNSQNEFLLLDKCEIKEEVPEMIDELSRNVFNNDKCKDCYVKGFCNGGCLIERKKNRDDYNSPNEILCYNMKKIFNVYHSYPKELLKNIYNETLKLELGHLDYCYNNGINITMDDYFKKG